MRTYLAKHHHDAFLLPWPLFAASNTQVLRGAAGHASGVARRASKQAFFGVFFGLGGMGQGSGEKAASSGGEQSLELRGNMKMAIHRPQCLGCGLGGA